MDYDKKIVLFSRSGYRPDLDKLVEDFMRSGVRFVGVVGKEASKIEEIIDELCVGDGSHPYFILTSSHPEETLDEAVEFANSLVLEYEGATQIVEF
jgi:hypothetical protein